MQLISTLISRMKGELFLSVILMTIWIPFQALQQLWPAFLIAGMVNLLPILILVINYYMFAISEENTLKYNMIKDLDENKILLMTGLNEFAWGGNFEFFKIENSDGSIRCFVPFCNSSIFNRVKSLNFEYKQEQSFFPIIF